MANPQGGNNNNRNNNRGNNNNTRNQENYFDQNIKKAGGNTDFHKLKDPKSLTMDCIRIFRDLARGKIDTVKYGKYFLDPQFLAAMIATATTKYTIYSIQFMGTKMLVDSLPTTADKDTALAVMNQNKSSMEGYTILLEMLNVIKATGDMYQSVQYVQRLYTYYRNAL